MTHKLSLPHSPSMRKYKMKKFKPSTSSDSPSIPTNLMNELMSRQSVKHTQKEKIPPDNKGKKLEKTPNWLNTKSSTKAVQQPLNTEARQHSALSSQIPVTIASSFADKRKMFEQAAASLQAPSLQSANRRGVSLFPPSLQATQLVQQPVPFLPDSVAELTDAIRTKVIFKDSEIADNQALIKALDHILALAPTVNEIHGSLLNALWLKTTLGREPLYHKVHNIPSLDLEMYLLKPYVGKSLPQNYKYTDKMARRLLNAIHYLEHRAITTSSKPVASNKDLPIWERFILQTCIGYLDKYTGSGNKLFQNEVISGAKSQLATFARQALENYFSQQQQLDIISYARRVFDNTVVENNKLESKKSTSKARKRLSQIVPVSFKDYQQHGDTFYTPTGANDTDELLMARNSTKDVTKFRDVIAELAEAEEILSIKSWSELLQVVNSEKIDVYGGSLGSYVNKALCFLQSANDVLHAASNHSFLASFLQTEYKRANANSQNQTLDLRKIFNGAGSSLLSGEVSYYLKHGYQRIFNDLLSSTQTKSVVDLTRDIDAIETNQKLGAYLLTGLDRWLRNIYTSTLRQVVDSQGKLLPAIRKALPIATAGDLKTLLLQLGIKQTSTDEQVNEQLLVDYLHLNLLKIALYSVQHDIQSYKEKNAYQYFAYLVGISHKRIEYKGLLLYPFLIEMKTILNHLGALCKEYAMQQQVDGCLTILQDVDSLLHSKTKPAEKEVNKLILQAKKFIEQLQFPIEAPLADRFLAAVRPILKYWLESISAFSNDSPFVTSTPNIVNVFLADYGKFFAKSLTAKLPEQVTIYKIKTDKKSTVLSRSSIYEVLEDSASNIKSTEADKKTFLQYESDEYFSDTSDSEEESSITDMLNSQQLEEDVPSSSFYKLNLM
jgi:hypothetical protein